jgi:hypothetical protein
MAQGHERAPALVVARGSVRPGEDQDFQRFARVRVVNPLIAV